MEFKKTSISGDITILAADFYVAVPMTITGAEEVKAGTPITESGAVGTVSTAYGVLLHDVTTTVNPNAAVVVKGVIDATKAKAHSGIDLTGIGDVVPGIVLRTNIGVNA